jgi:hypothetical protein
MPFDPDAPFAPPDTPALPDSITEAAEVSAISNFYVRLQVASTLEEVIALAEDWLPTYEMAILENWLNAHWTSMEPAEGYSNLDLLKIFLQDLFEKVTSTEVTVPGEEADCDWDTWVAMSDEQQAAFLWAGLTPPDPSGEAGYDPSSPGPSGGLTWEDWESMSDEEKAWYGREDVTGGAPSPTPPLIAEGAISSWNPMEPDTPLEKFISAILFWMTHINNDDYAGLVDEDGNLKTSFDPKDPPTEEEVAAALAAFNDKYGDAVPLYDEDGNLKTSWDPKEAPTEEEKAAALAAFEEKYADAADLYDEDGNLKTSWDTREEDSWWEQFWKKLLWALMMYLARLKEEDPPIPLKDPDATGFSYVSPEKNWPLPPTPNQGVKFNDGLLGGTFTTDPPVPHQPAEVFGALSVDGNIERQYEAQPGDPVHGELRRTRTYSPFVITVHPPDEYLSVVTGTLGATEWGGWRTDNGVMTSLVGMNSSVSGGHDLTQRTMGTLNTLISNQALREYNPAFFTANMCADIWEQLITIARTPPLVLLINPSDMTINYTKAQQFTDRTRHGYIFQSWGESPPTLNISGSIGAFYAATTQLGGGSSSGTFDVSGMSGSFDQQETTSVSGNQEASRAYSASYQNLMNLMTIYMNNGYVRDRANSSHHRPSLAHHMIGAIRLTFDGFTYEGHFDKFEYSFEEGKNRGGLKFSFDFTVMRMLDHQEPSYYVKPLDQPNIPARGNPSSQIAEGPRGPNGEMLGWGEMVAWEGTNTIWGENATMQMESIERDYHHPAAGDFGIDGVTPSESLANSAVFGDDRHDGIDSGYGTEGYWDTLGKIWGRTSDDGNAGTLSNANNPDADGDGHYGSDDEYPDDPERS